MQYYTSGLMYPLYTILKASTSYLRKFLWTIRSTAIALLAAFKHCVLGFELFVTYTPK